MTWERAMVALLDDLEQQASGLHLAERDAEVAELSHAEYAQVTLAQRWHASLARDLRVRLVGGTQLSGRLARVGQDWLLLVEGEQREWIVRTEAVVSATGLSARADDETTWSVIDRLSLRSVLRGVVQEAPRLVMLLADDRQLVGRVLRVGADFVELEVGEGREATVQVVRLGAVAALQGQS